MQRFRGRPIFIRVKGAFCIDTHLDTCYALDLLVLKSLVALVDVINQHLHANRQTGLAGCVYAMKLQVAGAPLPKDHYPPG